jgi:putative membrane protein
MELSILSIAILSVVALQHFGFMYLEMFLWEKPVGLKTFRMTPEVARLSADLAKNQGLYNGFLAAGIVWSLITGNVDASGYFLVCVAIAGMYGAYTVSKRIFYVQSCPAILGLVTIYVL